METGDLSNSTIIAVDTGNKLIKTVNTTFLAGLSPVTANIAAPLGDPYDTITINGRSYAISLERSGWERDKTGNSTYLSLSLIAVAKELKYRRLPPDANIVLSVGLPPGHLADGTVVSRFKQYFLADGNRYEFVCGDVKHNVGVRRVIVCPQGFSALFTLNDDLILKPSLYIIDIGGGTADTIHLEHGRHDNNSISLDMGVIPMYAAIQAQMEARHGRKITEAQIDDILMRSNFTFFEQVHINLVYDEAEKHIQRLLAKHKDMGADLKSAFVVFLGGGSLLLERQIKRIASDAAGGHLILGDIHANAKGFEIFARKRLGR